MLLILSLLQKGRDGDPAACNPAAFSILTGGAVASSHASDHCNSSTQFSALEIHDSQKE